MAGWFFKGTCYAEQQQAIDTHFQSIQPQLEMTTSPMAAFQYLKQSTGEWVGNHYTIDNSGTITSQYFVLVPIPNFTECQTPDDPTTQFLNGMELGWAVAGVMLIVFLIRRTYRGF